MRRILVLQPGESLGGIVRRMVGSRHEVIECHDSASLAQHVSAGPPFDAIICDVQDPGAVFEILSKLDATHAQKTLFLVPPASMGAVDNLPNRRLQKPFSLSQLSGALASILDEASGP